MFSPLFRRSKPLVFAPDLDFNLHPKRFPVSVNHLLTGFCQGYKINGYSGPRAPKEYSNFSCANTDALVIVPWATQWGLFAPLPSQTNLQVYPTGVISKKHSSKLRTIFTFRIRNTAPPVSPPTFLPSPILCNTLTLTMQLPYFRISAQNASCPN